MRILLTPFIFFGFLWVNYMALIPHRRLQIHFRFAKKVFSV